VHRNVRVVNTLLLLLVQSSRIPLLQDEIEFFDEGVVLPRDRRPLGKTSNNHVSSVDSNNIKDADAMRPMTSVTGRRRR
jgi:hypothetical protein